MKNRNQRKQYKNSTVGTLLITALASLRQEGCAFKASWGCSTYVQLEKKGKKKWRERGKEQEEKEEGREEIKVKETNIETSFIFPISFFITLRL